MLSFSVYTGSGRRRTKKRENGKWEFGLLNDAKKREGWFEWEMPNLFEGGLDDRLWKKYVATPSLKWMNLICRIPEGAFPCCEHVL